jgi:protein-tyrosine phosphatase
MTANAEESAPPGEAMDACQEREGSASSAPHMREILFLCTGNYYRSRYAEALFNHEAVRRGLGWRACSRGLAVHLAPPGGLSPHTARRLQERAIPFTHTGSDPMQVSEADLARAGRVIALKGTEHRAWMARLHPSWLDRIEYWEISDLDAATPEVALAAIEAHVSALLDELEGPKPSKPRPDRSGHGVR